MSRTVSVVNTTASIQRRFGKTVYLINDKEVSREKFLMPATLLTLAALVTIAGGITAFIFTIVSLWENNLAGALTGAGILIGLHFLGRIGKPKKPIVITAGSIVRKAGTALMIVGIWYHSPVVIILGILLSIKITFSVK